VNKETNNWKKENDNHWDMFDIASLPHSKSRKTEKDKKKE
tara:strand:- start:514 stop:633 length:120 start_codon:yes stop_codon:yes gene_type:complete